MHYMTLTVSYYKFETPFMRYSDRVINDIKHQSMSSVHNYTFLTLLTYLLHGAEFFLTS